MCIIAYSPKGHKYIDDETIQRMFRANPNGAGFMIKTRKGVEYQKGFMDVDEFIYMLRRLPNNKEIALHFRIATDGGINPYNTHPFPVSNNMNDMHKLFGETDAVLMHNGIISWCKTGMKGEYSDTALFTANIIDKLKNNLDNKYFQSLIENSINYSRLLIFRHKKKTVKLGGWQKDGEVFYSNGSYKKQKATIFSNTMASLCGYPKEFLDKVAFWANDIPYDEDGYPIDERLEGVCEA